MSFITKDDLAGVMYEGNIDTISRGDDSKVEFAINSAIAQSAKYLIDYDTAAIFALTGQDRNPYADLMQYVKDIAKWHFIAVCNAAVDLPMAEKRYTFALEELAKIKTSKELIPGWAVLVVPDSSPTNSASGGNPRFNHYF